MSPEIVPNKQRRVRKYAANGRKEYTRRDGSVTQHELAIRELLKIRPDIQRNGFNLAVEQLWERIQSEFEKGEREPLPPIAFRPDAFLVNEDEQYLELFEVEDWGPLRANKREQLGRWWFHWDADGRHDWLPRLWLVNRYGMITTELPLSALYLESIAGSLDLTSRS
jgi:hypothetical protein